VAVGGHHEPGTHRDRQRRAVVALAKVLVVERGKEQLLDQLRRRPPAGPMAHVDASVADVERADVVLLHAATSTLTAMSLKRP